MDTRNIDACIKILEDKNSSWCKVYVNEIKEAFMYATNRCNHRITFIFMMDDYSRDMITMKLTNQN